MITTKTKLINSLFVIHLFLVSLIVVGILPRTVVPYWTLILMAYVLWASLEDSTTFFVRSIPFFIAIPIGAGFGELATGGFDSLNMWRVLSGLIFFKWLWQVWPNLGQYFKTRIAKVLWLLLLLAILSAIQAPSQALAIKRIVYFINLSLIGIVIHGLILKNQDFSQRLIKNIVIPTVTVALIGTIQQATTYFLDIFQFVDFWGGVVERNLFGNAWADTAIKANTWFAYFGDQLSLRMFSIFPDSHSFPIFLLLGLPAIMALALSRVVDKSPDSFQGMLKIRAGMLVVFVPILFLCLILTGTRGIWAAGATVSILAIIFIIWTYKLTAYRSPLAAFKYIASYLVIFFFLFGLAYYILATDQFQIAKGDTALAAKRTRSLFDISETSNARRIEIWKDSVRSIIKHPLLGVGIGNFPVVVGEDLARAKAGSSAHNLYLHIAAEMGIPALLLVFWFLWLLLKKLLHNFLNAKYQILNTVYFGSALIFLTWTLIYSLTDVAIFDERAFLLFAVMTAIIFVTKNGLVAERKHAVL